jgi:hypothetical protein
MVVIEHTSEKFKILEPENDILIKTNHYLHPELRKEDEVLKRNPSTTSFLRYFEAFQKLTSKKDSLKFGDIIKILGDKKSSLCQNTPRIKTIWSLALDMGRKKYKIYWNLHKKRKEKELKL